MTVMLSETQGAFLAKYLNWQGNKNDPAHGDWLRARGGLERRVAAALQNGSVEDPSGLRARWQYAVEQAEAANFSAALTAVPGIERLLSMPAPGPEQFSIVAFQRARIMWLDTKRTMIAGAQALADAVVAQGADDEDADKVSEAARQIVGHVDEIDSRLESVLDAITTAGTPRERQQLKAVALGVVREYQALLNSPFFSMVDDNPFKAVAVAGPARASLNVIANVLK